MKNASAELLGEVGPDEAEPYRALLKGVLKNLRATIRHLQRTLGAGAIRRTLTPAAHQG